ncbi:MAG: SH3 domain-containing protein, partial [Desulfuromonadales bacterium]|nr:SH3 domain-containing protein [Desulfuromonadales bacterium]NIR33604.1 SH3 domain-containing protein [Desulfuromonadales bacterium]NIS39750.1 SH3 domain-containing protein [Desulfuromonadales bacterium]
RKGPGTNYPIKFRGQLGVTFRVLETKGDWIHIKHESGNTGWIFGNLTWGAR